MRQINICPPHINQSVNSQGLVRHRSDGEGSDDGTGDQEQLGTERGGVRVVVVVAVVPR
jgi:hypothetical protein